MFEVKESVEEMTMVRIRILLRNVTRILKDVMFLCWFDLKMFLDDKLRFQKKKKIEIKEKNYLGRKYTSPLK